MARIKTVESARASKKERKCRRCGHVVQVGDAYKYVDKRVGARGSLRMVFCKDHSPNQSEMLSGRGAELASVTESMWDEYAQLTVDVENKQSFVDFAGLYASEIEGFAESIRDGSDNIEQGFGHSTVQSDAMASTANELDEWAGKIRDVHTDLENFDPENLDEGKEAESAFQELVDQLESDLREEPELNLTG